MYQYDCQESLLKSEVFHIVCTHYCLRNVLYICTCNVPAGIHYIEKQVYYINLDMMNKLLNDTTHPTNQAYKKLPRGWKCDPSGVTHVWENVQICQKGLICPNIARRYEQWTCGR